MCIELLFEIRMKRLDKRQKIEGGIIELEDSVIYHVPFLYLLVIGWLVQCVV